MASPGTFATALNCMDGRCQEKATAFVREKTGADFIDMITEPGVDGLLAGEHSVVADADMAHRAEWVRAKAAISAQGHGSKSVVIFGHCACAGNQVDEAAHIVHLAAAKKVVEGWRLFENVYTAVFNDEFGLREIQDGPAGGSRGMMGVGN